MGYLGSVESEVCPYPWWMQTWVRWRVWTEKQLLEAKKDTEVWHQHMCFTQKNEKRTKMNKIDKHPTPNKWLLIYPFH